MLKLAKKMTGWLSACHFFSFGDGALMVSASAGSSVPQVKEVHALNLHEANVDH